MVSSTAIPRAIENVIAVDGLNFIPEKPIIAAAATSGNIEFQHVINGEVLAKFISNGAVELYYDNAKKLETSSSGISVTGNVSVSGTVDGRDVASDGSKLDGIESGATADQTAAEILTAITVSYTHLTLPTNREV